MKIGEKRVHAKDAEARGGDKGGEWRGRGLGVSKGGYEIIFNEKS